ncbi:MAG: ABC transporter permease subunit [Armatimonadota bacterium]|nr:ABC transporter permease subunit [Armatimonadota bacterium]MDR7486034.1 ABC transporter permease subunit [Armatimonadota bacterium]MDR7532605.1 ABC transporter permease subunit [Armatimonadota bacterium]MDR7536186.1 ABC transporter permease subunit [Armatimonadota bacterium]
MGAPSRRALLALARVATAAGLLSAWEAGVRAGAIDPFYVSTPSAILVRAAAWVASGYILPHVTATLAVTLSGLALGVALGAAVGGALAASPRATRIVLPFLAAGNAVPRVILYPLLVLWLGVGAAPRIVLVVTLVFFVAAFNTHAAVTAVDRDVVHAARVLGARRVQLLWHVYLPAVAVWLLGTVRVTMGFALAGTIVGEYVGASRGVGVVVAFAQSMFNARDVLAGLTVLLAMIWAIDAALRAVERAASRWRLVEVI